MSEFAPERPPTQRNLLFQVRATLVFRGHRDADPFYVFETDTELLVIVAGVRKVRAEVVRVDMGRIQPVMQQGMSNSLEDDLREDLRPILPVWVRIAFMLLPFERPKTINKNLIEGSWRMGGKDALRAVFKEQFEALEGERRLLALAAEFDEKR